MSRHAYASRDSPPSHTLLDQNLDPRVHGLLYRDSFIWQYLFQKHIELGNIELLKYIKVRNHLVAPTLKFSKICRIERRVRRNKCIFIMNHLKLTN